LFSSVNSAELTRFTQFLDKTKVETDVWTEQFIARYGDIHPIFIGGPFSEMLKDAKEAVRPVVANIHSKSIDCKDFSRYEHKTRNSSSFSAYKWRVASLVLTSGPLASFLAENFMFWVGYVDPKQEEEAGKVISHALRLPLQKQGAALTLNYPITAVFGHIDGSLSVLEVIQGCCTADEMIAKLMAVVDNYAPMQERARARKCGELVR